MFILFSRKGGRESQMDATESDFARARRQWGREGVYRTGNTE
jgi:hypothetical protein